MLLAGYGAVGMVIVQIDGAVGSYYGDEAYLVRIFVFDPFLILFGWKADIELPSVSIASIPGAALCNWLNSHSQQLIGVLLPPGDTVFCPMPFLTAKLI